MPRRLTDDDYEDVDVRVVERTTDKAVLVRTVAGGKHWLPKAVLHPDDPEPGDGECDITLRVEARFADREGVE